MVDASVIVSIVIAVISLLGTLAIAAFNYYAETLRDKRQQEARLKALTETYSQPLIIATYELAKRLYELLEFPISKQHLETQEGLEDIKIFTCYKFAQYMAWTHVLRSKTQYFSFSENVVLDEITDQILRLDEEFDRRRDNRGCNIGVWPGYRVLVSERMLKPAVKEQGATLDAMVKGYDEFHREWETQFRSLMGYFCQWIDDMVEGRKVRHQHWDDAMRCTQHNLYDMLQALKKIREYQKKYLFNDLLLCGKSEDCDCNECEPGTRYQTLQTRAESRNNDAGFRPFYGPKPYYARKARANWIKEDSWQSEYESSIDLKLMRRMTCTEGYEQGIRIP